MKKLLALLFTLSLLTACDMPAPADGLDAQADASALEAGQEVVSDALPPHVDGGGID